MSAAEPGGETPVLGSTGAEPPRNDGTAQSPSPWNFGAILQLADYLEKSDLGTDKFEQFVKKHGRVPGGAIGELRQFVDLPVSNLLEAACIPRLYQGFPALPVLDHGGTGGT